MERGKFLNRKRKKSKNIKKNKSNIKLIDKKELFLYISLFILVIISASYFLFFQNSYELYSSKKQMFEVVKNIRTLEKHIKANQDEIIDIVNKYREKTGKDINSSEIFNLNRGEDQLLKERIRREQDISIKNLLGEILDKKSEIIDLKNKVKYFENLLPKPHIVEEGENHFGIAMDFLINNRKIDKETALKLVERTLLFDPLIPEFKVWNFYSNGEFGSIITQGLASISPNEIKRIEKKKITNERDIAVSERDKLAKDLKLLYLKRKEIIDQIGNLESEKSSLIERVGELSDINKKIIKSVNSVFYICQKKTVLKKTGFIKGGFLKRLKMQEIPPDRFSKSIDLRELDYIKIDNSKFSLLQIKKISIFPRFYKKGLDFTVEFRKNRRVGFIRFIKKEKFKNERILIAVE